MADVQAGGSDHGTEARPRRTVQCRYCPEQVIWTLTERGARMPVDPNPSPKGSFLLKDRNGFIEAVYMGQGGSKPLYISHFATCAGADRARKVR